MQEDQLAPSASPHNPVVQQKLDSPVGLLLVAFVLPVIAILFFSLFDFAAFFGQ